MVRLNDAEVAEFVAASCLAQGVPVKVSDPSVLENVVALLGVGDGRAAARASGCRPPTLPGEGRRGIKASALEVTGATSA